MSKRQRLYSLFVRQKDREYFTCWLNNITYERGQKIMRVLEEGRSYYNQSIDEMCLTCEPDNVFYRIRNLNQYQRKMPQLMRKATI